MKKFITILFFMLILIPNIAGHMAAGEEVNLENRDLAELPDVTKENWKEIPKLTEAYINDRAPFRAQLLNGYAVFNWNVFKTADNRNVVLGKDGWLFYKGDGSLNDAIGVNIFPEELMAVLLEEFLEIREQYVEDPGQFVLFIAPNKELVYGDLLPAAFRPVADTPTVKTFITYIREHSDLKVVYPLEELKEAAGQTPVYYSTDTHWNEAGGFVGTQMLIESLGGVSTELDKVDIQWDREICRGDLANQIHIPDRFVRDREGHIQGYLDGDEPETEEGTYVFKSHREDAPDGRSVVMVRDSFGENMMPWLAQYFKDTKVVHYSYVGEMEKSDMEGDVFVYEVVERYLGRLPGQLGDLRKEP